MQIDAQKVHDVHFFNRLGSFNQTQINFDEIDDVFLMTHRLVWIFVVWVAHYIQPMVALLLNGHKLPFEIIHGPN